MKKKYLMFGVITLIIIAVIIMIILLFRINIIKSNEKDLSSGLEIINSIEEKPEIEKYEYNQYMTKVIEDQDMTNIYFNNYKYYLIYHPEEAYNLLDKEYREKKYGDFQTYKNYIDQNIEQIFNSSIESFTVSNWSDGKQYIVTDKNGKYYIFRENVVMDYTVILDTYTIDLPQFTEKYNSSSDAEKVLLNIQKIFSAINDEDYNYVYNKLDNTFKQNNFPTLESFSNYIKQNFYENNSIGYSNYKTSGDLHIYEISITDKDNEANPTVTKNFIMQLKDGTDFVMSFNV